MICGHDLCFLRHLSSETLAADIVTRQSGARRHRCDSFETQSLKFSVGHLNVGTIPRHPLSWTWKRSSPRIRWHWRHRHPGKPQPWPIYRWASSESKKSLRPCCDFEPITTCSWCFIKMVPPRSIIMWAFRIVTILPLFWLQSSFTCRVWGTTLESTMIYYWSRHF